MLPKFLCSFILFYMVSHTLNFHGLENAVLLVGMPQTRTTLLPGTGFSQSLLTGVLREINQSRTQCQHLSFYITEPLVIQTSILSNVYYGASIVPGTGLCQGKGGSKII